MSIRLPTEVLLRIVSVITDPLTLRAIRLVGKNGLALLDQVTSVNIEYWPLSCLHSRLKGLFGLRGNSIKVNGTLMVDSEEHSLPLCYQHLTLWYKVPLSKPELLVPLFRQTSNDASKFLHVYNCYSRLVGEAEEGYVSESIQYIDENRLHSFPLEGSKIIIRYSKLSSRVKDKNVKALWVRANRSEPFYDTALTRYITHLRSDSLFFLRMDSFPCLTHIEGPIFIDTLKLSALERLPEIVNVDPEIDECIEDALLTGKQLRIWAPKELLGYYRQKYGGLECVVDFCELV